MVVSRRGPKGARYYGPFGLSVLAMSLMPRQIGYQDMVALMARQPEVSQRARAHMLASPFGTIHAATFSFPQPVGTLIPEPSLYQVASGGALDSEITGAIERERSGAAMPLHRPRLDFPSVNRRLKGDLLVTLPREEPLPAQGTRDLTPGRVKTVSFHRPADVPPVAPPAARIVPPAAALAPSAPKMEYGSRNAPDAAKSEAEVVMAALSLGRDDEILIVPESRAAAGPEPKSGSRPSSYMLAALPAEPRVLPVEELAPLESLDDRNAAVRLGRLYFGNNPAETAGTILPWPMDEELLIQTPPANDPDIKKSALTQPLANEPDREPSDAKSDTKAPASPAGGRTVAAKGEVTGAGKRPKTPAERLGLDQKQRAKSEKCLAEAVYFESRGEPKRGQIAVAQVVMNRVFSGFYPTNVCGVVYQNAHRKLACQFTFACDNVRDVVTEPDMWAQAKEIAHDMLDGKLWLPEVGHSTHYHAYWVHPSWVREMRRMQKIGVHSFYRPRAWGDGSDVPPLNQSQKQSQAGDAAKAKL